MRRDFTTTGPAIVTLTTLGAAFLLVPLVVIVWYSVQDGQYFELVPRALSLRWWREAIANERFVEAGLVSLATALLITPLGIALALPTAFALVRYDFPGRGVLNLLVMSPLLIPGVVTGIAFLTFFGLIGLDHGATRNAIAMVCFTYPFAVRAIAANLQGIGPVWEDAAASLGATRTQVWWQVLLPLLRPGMLAAGIFVFVESVDNFTISVFLVTRASTTLPVEVYGYIRDFDDPSVAVVAVASILLSTALMMAVERWIGLDRFLRHG